MPLFQGRLSLVLALMCVACEFHAGDPDWHPRWHDYDDDDAGQVDGAVSHRDADTDGDAGPGDANRDAAANGGNDAGQDGAVASQDASVDPPDSPLTPADVAGVLARGTCGALEACMGARMLRDSLDGKDCVEFRTHVNSDGDLRWLEKSVSLGRVIFHADRLAACERDLTALGCSVQSQRLPASCEAALEGTAETDQDCAIDHECKGTGYCAKDMFETCPGACDVLRVEGQPCGASSQCVDGLICRKPPAAAASDSPVCTAPLSEGDDCFTWGGYGECPPGLVCQGTNGNLHCQSIASVYTGKQGDACDIYGQLCEDGLVCASQSGTAGLCAPPSAENAVCRRAVPNQCPTGQYCKNASSASTARATPGVDGICSDLPAAGQSCAAATSCMPYSVCASDNQCYALHGIGETCASSGECYGSRCEDGMCAATLDCNAQP